MLQPALKKQLCAVCVNVNKSSGCLNLQMSTENIEDTTSAALLMSPAQSAAKLCFVLTFWYYIVSFNGTFGTCPTFARVWFTLPGKAVWKPSHTSCFTICILCQLIYIVGAQLDDKRKQQKNSEDSCVSQKERTWCFFFVSEFLNLKAAPTLLATKVT